MPKRRSQSPPTIAIVGAGFVGVTTAIVFAERGHAVHLVDVDPKRIEALRRATAPFYEPGVNEALGRLVPSGRIQTHVGLGEIDGPRFLFLCVGTPAQPDGSADLQFLKGATRDVARHLKAWENPPTIVVKSTVPPGTLRRQVLPVLRRVGTLGETFGLASNPEFLREGSALADGRKPDRIVVGPMDPLAKRAVRSLYRGFTCPYVETDPETSETIKYVANAFLAAKVAYSNEIGNLCERLGIDVYRVMEGVGLDARIGNQFLRAGVGFGGSCFPKDLAALRDVARKHGVKLGILEAVIANNEAQPHRAVDLAREMVGSLKGKRVALLGLAFKPATSDVRETRALPIYRALKEAGADVRCYDPIAGPAFGELLKDSVQLAATSGDALEGSDVCIVQTEWPEFRELKPEDFLGRMRTPVIIDGRRALDGPALEAAGVLYRAIGRGGPDGANR